MVATTAPCHYQLSLHMRLRALSNQLLRITIARREIVRAKPNGLDIFLILNPNIIGCKCFNDGQPAHNLVNVMRRFRAQNLIGNFYELKLPL